jgi:hypothetical protein
MASNSIGITQNKLLQLQRLAAQRSLYSKAKTMKILQNILTIPGVLVFSLLVALYPKAQIWAAIYGLSVAIFDVVLEKRQKDLRHLAAKIQELFDCDVLRIEWNKVLVGPRPEHELTVKACRKDESSDPAFSGLKNWYPVSVEKLPPALGRIVCQRANCWWDMDLRRNYARTIIGLFTIMALLVFLIGLIGGMTLEKFVLVVAAPLISVFLWSVREYREQREAAEEQSNLKIAIEELWEIALDKGMSMERLEENSRRIQDKIFIQRRNNPLIFDWIYSYLRDQRETEMNQGAEFLVEEALKSK